MKKTGTKANFVLAITFFIVSINWFLIMKSTIGGIAWSVAALAELIIGLISNKKEKGNESKPD